jgi:hypothetical protein
VTNQDYGVLIDGTDYYDVDLDILQQRPKNKSSIVTTDLLFVSITDGQIVISINGLSFADVLYAKEIPSESKFNIVVDQEYTSDEILNNTHLVQI